MPDVCLHNKGFRDRTEVASVDIAQCVACDKDVEFDFATGAPNGWMLERKELRGTLLRGPTRNGKPLRFPNLDSDPTLPDVLDAIAAWMDKIDDRDPNPFASREVQRDLRQWAGEIRAALGWWPDR